MNLTLQLRDEAAMPTVDHDFHRSHCSLSIDDLICEGESFDTDSPAAGTARELLWSAKTLFAETRHYKRSADQGWNTATTILGMLSELVPASELESVMQRCAGIAYRHVFGGNATVAAHA
jgi:hypothetical protein